MNLNQLYYFKTLAELEHYTKAAEKLNISQPTLSHSISSMEKELGANLFEKQGRNVVLTKYGRIYMFYVENALTQLELGKNQIERLVSEGGRTRWAGVYDIGRDELCPRTDCRLSG